FSLMTAASWIVHSTGTCMIVSSNREVDPDLSLVGSPLCWRSRNLLTFAAHLVIPIHESSLRIIPPRPDVEFEMCGQAVPVRAVYELERLSLEHRRTRVTRPPGVRNYDKLHTHQL